ncbi:unnamed protein product [Lepidochelys kempii]
MNVTSVPDDWTRSFHSSFLRPVLSKNVKLAVSILDSIMEGIIEIEILSHLMQKVRELMLCCIHTICLPGLIFLLSVGENKCALEKVTHLQCCTHHLGSESRPSVPSAA